jgi:phosphatase and actin regulator 4
LVLIDEATAKGEGLYHESASISAINGFVCVGLVRSGHVVIACLEEARVEVWAPCYKLSACVVMSIRVSGVYLVHSPGQPSSPEKGNAGSDGVVGVVKPTAVAIVTPQRSNSLDYLNFEEKRQIIASSLSLSDFLHHRPAGVPPATKGVAATKVIVGKLNMQKESWPG